jgi:FixJ family two-component response regulator
MNFRDFASQPFTRADLDRLTEEEEQVLVKRRRGASVIQTAFDLNMSRASVHRRQNSIMHKLP